MLSRRSLIPTLLASAATMDGWLGATPGFAQSGRAAMAPEFAGIAGWLNADERLTMAELRGRVVLVDFWTAGAPFHT